MAQTNDSQEQVTINVETLQPVTRTLMTIGALPTSYLISMTYEEQLLWLQNYLIQTVIPAINNNAEATQEVQDIVMALQQYINDYFNNLDVQEEINNKLEQMAQDGSLTTLIEDYVNPYIEAQNQEINEFKTSVNSQIAEQNAQIQAVTSGSPLVASSVSGMTDTTRVYVNTTDGNWYYYNGSVWTIGGTYQSTRIADGSITKYMLDDSLNNLINDLVETVSSDNIYNYEMTKESGYYSLSSGAPRESDEYFRTVDYIPITEDISSLIFGIYNQSDGSYVAVLNPIIIFYDSNKTFISGLQTTAYFNIPENARYIRFSALKQYDKEYNDTYEIMLYKGNSSPSNFIDYSQPYNVIKTSAIPIEYIKEELDFIKYNTITVKQDGTGDFTRVQDAIASITDNNQYNQYIIEISEGNYNLAEDFTQQQLQPDYNFSGIFVPNFTKLVGFGDKRNVVLYVDLQVKHQYISTLNFYNTGELENLTIRGTKTRYALHDDLAENIGGYKRRIKNCIIKGIDTFYSVTCGCGLKEGADWEYENTIFDGTQSGNNSSNALAYTVHNNTGFNKNCNIKFKNCRFLTNRNDGSLLLKTISHKTSSGQDANNMVTNVQFIGCKFGTGTTGFSLVEENPTSYGTGCLYEVSGYANVNDEYTIVTTDGIDYSDRVDLI